VLLVLLSGVGSVPIVALNWGGASAAPNTQREHSDNIKDIFFYACNLRPQKMEA